MMNNRIIIRILFLALLLMLIGFFVPSVDGIGLSLFVLVGYYFLLVNGRFIHTHLFRYVRIDISLFLVGTLFKIMHWPFADIIITTALLGFMILYGIHFLRKKNKNSIDYGKLFFLETEIILVLFKLMHTPYPEEILILCNILFVIFVLFYINKNHRKESQFR